MLLLNLDDKHQGIAVIDGMSYRVTGTYGLSSRVIYLATGNRHKFTIDLILNDSLDEEQQRKRIDRLENELQVERDRLDEIRRAINGGDESNE